MAVFDDIKEGLEQAIEYEMYEAIVEYFETEENWSKLQRCYLINGESADFRRMLREAMGLEEDDE